MKTIALTWKCRCMLEEAVVDVRARARGDDIAEWMEEVVTPAISRAHRARSPLCVSPAVEYLKLPVPPGGGPVGSSKEDLN
jgi:hypothetical protein